MLQAERAGTPASARAPEAHAADPRARRRVTFAETPAPPTAEERARRRKAFAAELRQFELPAPAGYWTSTAISGALPADGKLPEARVAYAAGRYGLEDYRLRHQAASPTPAEVFGPVARLAWRGPAIPEWPKAIPPRWRVRADPYHYERVEPGLPLASRSSRGAEWP